MKKLKFIFILVTLYSCTNVSKHNYSSEAHMHYEVKDTINLANKCILNQQQVFVVKDTSDTDELKQYLAFTQRGKILNLIEMPNGQDYNGFNLSYSNYTSGFAIITSWGTTCKINSEYHLSCNEDNFYVSSVIHERYNCDTLGSSQMDTFLVNMPMNEYRINPWIEEEYSTYRKYSIHKR